ncbi:metal-sensitive transcriptional regulator [Tissierella sp. Yu-01]|uniref:metal-sensitive transcriptional regulator n=1 Tax=Tissierella sp. Yu-01 TaxID=3035694 RepID=UPI00240D638F|nr:metal-sensitive transcriptional regulator [Tissierella sp. Yu-01]WFA09840.1 metal-sensitive transcriptional regulator [Tissierella sp. Yu-01]
MAEKNDIIKRLRRIEGQIKGIQKMIDEEQFCGDILIQIAAVRSALNNAGGLILENYMHKCLIPNTEGQVEEEDLNKLIDVMLKYTKQR